MNLIALSLLSACILTAVVLRFLLVGLKRRPLEAVFPPGPKPRFLLGNWRDLPHSDEVSWKSYARWKEIYGDIVHFEAFGRHVVALNSYTAAREMLEKRAIIYSGRPTLPMLGQLMGFDQTSIGLIQYGPMWKDRRKLVHQMIQKSAIAKLWPDLTSGAHSFLNLALDSPDDLHACLRLALGAVLLRSTYGIHATSPSDQYLSAAEESLHALEVGAFGNYVVDFIPGLRYVPIWFPFFKFKKHAKFWEDLRLQVVDKPFDLVKYKKASGIPQPLSIAASLLSGNNNEQSVKYACSALYGAGLDTTLVTLKTIVFALMMFPEVRARAQDEVDALIGVGDDMQRLPTFEDRQYLPYINALIKEALRWHVAVPLGIAHSAIEDDVFRGYFVPKDTVIHANLWAMSRDEAYYDNPDEFRPERFLGQEPQLDPYDFAFGFGRRTCVGIPFADSELFIFTASIVAAFDILKPIDNKGHIIEPQARGSQGGFTFDYECRLRVRSSHVATLIRSAEVNS